MTTSAHMGGGVIYLEVIQMPFFNNQLLITYHTLFKMQSNS